MALRNTYAVRTDLSIRRLTEPINMHSISSALHQHWSLLDIISYGALAMCYAFIMTRTSFAHGGLLGLALFSLGYWWLGILLFCRLPNGEHGYNQVKAIWYYFTPANKRLDTRPMALAYYVDKCYGYGLVKNKNDNKPYIVTSSGTIWFSDNNDYGYLYEVFGTASALLFKDTQDSVLSSTANFYRTLSPSVHCEFITLKSGQRVNRQVEFKNDQAQAWQQSAPSLAALAREESRVLTDYVGSSFVTLRQFMLVRADSERDLMTFDHNLNYYISYGGDRFLKDARQITDQQSVLNFLHNHNASPATQRSLDAQ